ncbi:hypothetical protein LTR79_007219 [Exophiala xenobiotica]|nr:hypothetical protein LTR79_007219 [Exophiala xenobiotica]
MSHSKRNTSLAFFTAHERSLLRSSWGTQSTRLSRDSFLPFGYCRLCLGPAVDPVTCPGEYESESGSNIAATGSTTGTTTGTGNVNVNGNQNIKVHLFCRECALNDLMAQRQEIKRLEREAEARETEKKDEEKRAEEAARREEVEMFERAEMMGYVNENETMAPGGMGTKRKRDVGVAAAAAAAEEMHARSTTITSTTAPDGNAHANATKRTKKENNSETSFWIPGSQRSTDDAGKGKGSSSLAKKLHPLCPAASTPSNKHPYSLKGLVTVRFSTEKSETDSGQQKKTNTNTNTNSTAAGVNVPICPSCKKMLTNTSRAMLGTAEGCGHVVCKGCADLLYGGRNDKKSKKNTSTTTGTTTTTTVAPAASCPASNGEEVEGGGSCGCEFSVNCGVHADTSTNPTFFQKDSGAAVDSLAECLALCDNNDKCTATIWCDDASSCGSDYHICWQTNGLGGVAGTGYGQISYKGSCSGSCSSSYEG